MDMNTKAVVKQGTSMKTSSSQRRKGLMWLYEVIDSQESAHTKAAHGGFHKAQISTGARPLLPESVGGLFSELLVTLANLKGDDDSLKWFFGRQHWWSFYMPDSGILRLRDELRYLWARNVPPTEKSRKHYQDPSSDLPEETRAAILEIGKQMTTEAMMYDDKQLIILCWLSSGSSGPPMILFGQGRIFPQPTYLRPMLAYAALDQARRFAVCQNPECPAPYFLARRKNQKYCERGPCTQYAQRVYSLGWWHRTGKSLRQERRSKR
jgi:hypothetical protein